MKRALAAPARRARRLRQGLDRPREGRDRRPTATPCRRARRPTSSRAACGSPPRGSSSSPTARPPTRSGASSSAATRTPPSRPARPSPTARRTASRSRRMKRYLDVAIADHPDGLVVSLPDVEALGPSIERAVKAGIPVITINSGADVFKSLGVLAHVGQPEYTAGVKSGERLAAAGVPQRAVRQPGVGQQRARRALPRAARRAQQGRRERRARSRSRCRTRRPRQRRMAAAITSGADRRHPHARPGRHGARDRRHQRQRHDQADHARDVRPQP